jgi:CheY-like chemotaxis protein
MPELDGPSTFKKLQNNPETAKIPVILLTAKVLSADRQRFAELGVTAIVAKPFDPMNLATQVAELLGWNF